MNSVKAWLKSLFCRHRRTHTEFRPAGNDYVLYRTTCMNCGRVCHTPRDVLDSYGRGPATMGQLLGFKFDA